MPYLNNDYKNFIRSRRWQRLRAYHLKHHPLCARCEAIGLAEPATEVHHIVKCHDDPQLQIDPNNLESICQAHHAPLAADDRRGYSKAMGLDGYFIDPNHPSNRGRHRVKLGTDATKLKANTGGRAK